MNNIKKSMPNFNLNDTFIFRNLCETEELSSYFSSNSYSKNNKTTKNSTLRSFENPQSKSMSSLLNMSTKTPNMETPSPRRYYFSAIKPPEVNNENDKRLTSEESNTDFTYLGVNDSVNKWGKRGSEKLVVLEDDKDEKSGTKKKEESKNKKKNAHPLTSELNISDFFSNPTSVKDESGLKLPKVVTGIRLTHKGDGMLSDEKKLKFVRSTVDIASDEQKENNLMEYLNALKSVSNREIKNGKLANYITLGNHVWHRKKRSNHKNHQKPKAGHSPENEEKDSPLDNLSKLGRSPRKVRISIDPGSVNMHSAREATRKGTFKSTLVLTLLKNKTSIQGDLSERKGRLRSKGEDRLLFNSRNSRAVVSVLKLEKLKIVSEGLLQNLRNMQEKIQNEKKFCNIIKKFITNKKSLKEVIFNQGDEEHLSPFLTKDLIEARCFVKEPVNIEGNVYFKERFDEVFLNDIWYLNDEVQSYLINRDISCLKNMEEALKKEYNNMKDMQDKIEPKIANGQNKLLSFKTPDRLNYKTLKISNPLHDQMEKFERQYGECIFVNMKSRMINKALEEVIDNLKDKI